MKNRIKKGSSMIGVYGRSDGSSSIQSSNGSESRESIDDNKQGKCVFCIIMVVFRYFIRLLFVLNHCKFNLASRSSKFSRVVK